MSEPQLPDSNVVHVDGQTGVQFVNTTGIDIELSELRRQMLNSPEVRALSEWAMRVTGGDRHSATKRQGGILARDKFVTPDRVSEQFALAREAAQSDESISGAIEITESLAFQRVSIFAEDLDEENVWNQIAGDLDLDSRLREIWRELLITSHAVVASYWGNKSYRVEGKSVNGVRRKKQFNNLRVPMALSLIDPAKVLPVGSMLFGREQLVYIADRGEAQNFLSTLDSINFDPIVSQLIVSPYEASQDEKRHLGQFTDENLDNLFLLNPDNVWRHTDTRPNYQPFADVRMKSVFDLLDLKHQQKHLDRTLLLSSSNFILLIRKGSDVQPAKPAELKALNAQVKTLATVPVIIGDHRLQVDIVTPDNDATLEPTRYNTLDSRIVARILGLMHTGNFQAGTKSDDTVSLARMVARVLESRRLMIRRAFEKNLLMKVFERNQQLTEKPKLRFDPKRVALDFDSTIAAFIQDLRDRGEISRETVLAELGFSQREEAARRDREREQGLDEIFNTNVPFSSNNPFNPDADPKTAGRRQGGAAPGSGQGQPPRNPRDSDNEGES